jgi:hypothetical protein
MAKVYRGLAISVLVIMASGCSTPPAGGSPKSSLEIANQYLELLQKMVVIGSIPISIYLFFRNRRRNVDYQDMQTYIDCKGLWIDYLRQCLNHPETKFNPFTAGHTSDTRESGGVKPIDKIFAHFLITMFERSSEAIQDIGLRSQVRISESHLPGVWNTHLPL